jgi:hypothetical protein
MRFGFSLLLHGSAAHSEGAEMSGTGLSDALRLFTEHHCHTIINKFD